MKRKTLISTLFAFVIAMCLISCSSLESDAKKLAKMQYELEQIGNSVGSTSNMYTEKAKEVFAFTTETWGKYSDDPVQKERFQQALDAESKALKRR